MQKKDKPFCNKKVSFAIEEEEKTVVIIPTVLKQKEKSKE